MRGKSVSYRGISYPLFLARWPFKLLWLRFMCPREMHLFDEYVSDRHGLVCDACQLDVLIADVDLTWWRLQ